MSKTERRTEVDPGDLADGVDPLSDKERAWLSRLERVLKDMPERLLLVECADSLILADRNAAKGVDLHDGGAWSNGVALSTVAGGTFKVTGVSG